MGMSASVGHIVPSDKMSHFLPRDKLSHQTNCPISSPETKCPTDALMHKKVMESCWDILSPVILSNFWETFERLLRYFRDFWATFERLLGHFWDTFGRLLSDF